jgi:hypothetical protein
MPSTQQKPWNNEQFKLWAGTTRIIGVGGFVTFGLPEINKIALGHVNWANIEGGGPVPGGWLFVLGFCLFVVGEFAAFMILRKVT